MSEHVKDLPTGVVRLTAGEREELARESQRRHCQSLRRLAVATGSRALLEAWARAELQRQLPEGGQGEGGEVPF